MTKTLYIVRHGQTDLNKQGIVQGRGRDTDLNAEGRKQAGLFYKAYQSVPFIKFIYPNLSAPDKASSNLLTKVSLTKNYPGLMN